MEQGHAAISRTIDFLSQRVMIYSTSTIQKQKVHNKAQ